VFGRRGFRNFLHPGKGFAHHLFTHVPPEKIAAWMPYRRNCASVMARQNGVTSYEIAQDLAGPSVFLGLRNYEEESCTTAILGGAPPYIATPEIEYVTKPAQDFALYAGARPVEYTDCDLFDGVTGPAAAVDYQAFMENLEPVTEEGIR